MHINLLKDKIILVTGASGGLGSTICKHIANEGGIPIIHYNSNADAANALCSEIIESGGKAFTIKFDIQDEAEVKKAIAEIKKTHTRIDGLVNNAGVLTRGFIPTHPIERFEQVVKINLTGNFCVLKHISLLMMNQKAGTIVNVSSLAGTLGLVGQAAYSSSKAGLNALTIVSAKEMAPYNIRVNGIAPGYIDAGMLKNKTNKDEEHKDAIPMKRFGKDSEVADLVIFLLSEKSSYITGQTVIIDGGLSISK
jgi:3-oxoacyl-[acyl-carrier protein] reductase